MLLIIEVLLTSALIFIAAFKLIVGKREEEEVEFVENPQLNYNYWTYLDVLEHQIEQLEIDWGLRFISEETYEIRKLDILAKLTEVKENYLFEAQMAMA